MYYDARIQDHQVYSSAAKSAIYLSAVRHLIISVLLGILNNSLLPGMLIIPELLGRLII